MSADEGGRWGRIRELFGRALDHPEADWPRLVEEWVTAEDDPALAERVLELLAEHRSGEGFLDPGSGPGRAMAAAAGDDPSPAGSRPDPHPVPERIGPWRLGEPLGQGGMGRIFRAVRDDEARDDVFRGAFRRRAAIKLLAPLPGSPGLDAPADGAAGLQGEIRRELGRWLARECRILASLEHPGIARVLDGGFTEEGLPYLVLEEVVGEPVDLHADHHRLGVEARLDLFLEILEAVRFAHANLVVHRDLKPDNILVTAEGHPKLLDFGVAALVNPGLDAALLGEAGAGLAGTPLTPGWSSPEQRRGEPVTTATDIYSLGLLLHLLLTGASPPKDGGHPRSPSEEVLALPEGIERGPLRSSISRRRLARRLSGDLDAIVARARAEDPEDRYTSVEALAADLEAHRERRPVRARGGGLADRLGRWVSRHRWASAAAASGLLLGIAFLVTLAVFADRLAAERDTARREREVAEGLTRFVVEVFGGLDPVAGFTEDADPLVLLDDASARLARDLGPAIEAVAGQPGDGAGGGPSSSRALRADLAATLGRVYGRRGRYDQAESLLIEALTLRRGPPESGSSPKAHPEVLETLVDLGEVRLEAGRPAEARQALEEALALIPEPSPDGAPSAEEAVRAAEVLNALGKVHHTEGDLEAAEERYREALALRRRALPPGHGEIAESLNNLAAVLSARGSLESAEALHREALALRRQLPGGGIEVSESLNNRADVLRALGRSEEALAAYEEALTLRRRFLGASHPRIGTTLSNLAVVLQDRGRLDEAEGCYDEALEIYRQSLGAGHPQVGGVLANLGSLAEDRGQGDRAEAFYRQAADLFAAALGPDHPNRALIRLNLAAVLEARGACAEAELHVAEADTALAPILPETHWRRAAGRSVRGACLARAGRPTEARDLLEASLQDLEASDAPRAKVRAETARARLAGL